MSKTASVAVRLINLDDATIDLILADTAEFERQHGVKSGRVVEQVIDTAKQFRQFWGMTGENGKWAGYLSADGSTGQLVGNGGFKGPPADGIVEIGYSTFEGFEGKKYAGLLAQALVELARQSPEVTTIIAHTLPEDGPSPRILRRIGMVLIGEVEHPEDGRVWRWELRIH